MEAADGKITQPDTGVVRQRMGPRDNAKGFFHGSEETDRYDKGSNPWQMKERRIQEPLYKISGDCRSSHPGDEREPEVTKQPKREQTDISPQGVNTSMGNVKNSQNSIDHRQPEGNQGI